MENVLYRSVIVPASEAPDGETPTEILVCKEVNAVIVWLHGHDEGLQLIKHFSYSTDQAIEFAVDEARRRRAGN